MTDKAMMELLNRWDTLVAKISELSPKLYEAYFKHSFLIGGVMTTIISAIAVIAACIIVLTLVQKGIKAHEEFERKPHNIYAHDDSDNYIVWAVFIGVLGVATLFLLFSGIAHLINPHYYAVRNIISMFLPK